MYFSRNMTSGKRKYLFVLTFVAFSAMIYAVLCNENSDGFDFARREILLRKIGHELLLQSGDSTSRVLPLKKISENEYQIRFENDFSFQPDSLVNITRRLLEDQFTTYYIVNVLNCGNSGVAYGYAISKDKKDDIVTCKGRTQPKSCYMINIKFKPTEIITAEHKYLLGSLSFLAFAGFIFFKSLKSGKTLAENKDKDIYNLGSILFDVRNRKLIINKNTIDLTVTETRVLLIFASSPNKTVERNRLQKEIWEDDGVIVGRSLDMFISKLRKKLECDPNINIVVVRSKGYKLEIN